MHGVAATPHQHSEVGARSQHGRPFDHLHTDSDHFQKIERLTVVLYDKTSVLSLGTHTICQHCFGNNRAVKAGSIIWS